MKTFKFVIIIIFISAKTLFSQETTENPSSFKHDFGIGIFEGDIETGIGISYTIGYQQAFWGNRLRLIPNLTIASFTNFMIMDIPKGSFGMLMLSANISLDVIRYKNVALYAGTGVFTAYSRGKLDSNYFKNYYYGVNLNTGLRISTKEKNFTIELSPLNFNFGPNYMIFAYWKLGIDIKLKHKNVQNK